GSFTVNITVSDGKASASQSFTVTISANHAPTLAAIPDQTIGQGRSLTVTLGGSDGDGDPLTYQVAISGNSLAYEVNQRLHLSYAGASFDNFFGGGEKWLTSFSDGQWYCMLSSGELRVWHGTWTDTKTSPDALVATFDPSFFQDLSKLYNASASIAPDVTWSVTGGVLTLTAGPSFTGSAK